MARPMLGDVELQHVQKIEIDGDQVLVEHEIPALEGNFFQGTGRRATRVSLTGVLTGTEAGEGLKTLREKFRVAEPISFVADITTATRVDQVLIEEMGVRELAGKPERFEYAITLRELVAPPSDPEVISEDIESEVNEDGQEEANQTVDQISENLGRLRVRVELADGSQNFTDIIVIAEGVSESGDRVNIVMEDQRNGVYSREDVPAGDYTVKVFRRLRG